MCATALKIKTVALKAKTMHTSEEEGAWLIYAPHRTTSAAPGGPPSPCLPACRGPHVLRPVPAWLCAPACQPLARAPGFKRAEMSDPLANFELVSKWTGHWREPVFE
jgi:hypothetical protein